MKGKNRAKYKTEKREGENKYIYVIYHFTIEKQPLYYLILAEAFR